MKHFLRQSTESRRERAMAIVLMAGLLFPVAAGWSQGRSLAMLMEESAPFLGAGSQQGYLGVELGEVDAQKAQTLKLKDAHGALITLIDHDAPAGKVGLRVNDVVLAFNGTPIEGAEQLRRLLRESPPGRTISLQVSREGNVQTLAVEIADRKAVEHDAWNKIDSGGDLFGSEPGKAMFAAGKGGGKGDSPSTGSFHLPFFGGAPNVGVVVEPLTGQMAEVLGVKSGLMVKQVSRRSAASVAGLKALDVILRVGSEPVTKLSGWERAMRSNEGKSVAVSILRERKAQTLLLHVDSKRHE